MQFPNHDHRAAARERVADQTKVSGGQWRHVRASIRVTSRSLPDSAPMSQSYRGGRGAPIASSKLARVALSVRTASTIW